MNDSFFTHACKQALRRGLSVLIVLFGCICATHATEEPAKLLAAEALDKVCQLPVLATEIPDGKIATEAQMLDAQAAVRYFDASITAYNLCLAETELRQAMLFPESAEALGIARAERNNAAVRLAEQAAAAFNSQLAAFRNRGYEPAASRENATALSQSYCNPGNQRKTTVNVDLKLSESGDVLEIDMPLGLDAGDQTIVRCLVRRMSFNAARRDGMAEPSPLTLAIQIGGGDELPTSSAESPHSVTSRAASIGLAPVAEIDRACDLPQPSDELRHPAIKTDIDLVANRSAVASFDAALMAYTLCLADAAATMAKRSPESATGLSDARIVRHKAAVAMGEQIAESSRRADLGFGSRALAPPIVEKWPSEGDARTCGRKLDVIAEVGGYFLVPTTVILRISVAGEIVGISYPPGTTSVTMRAIQCVLSGAKFSPAMRDGMAIADFLPLLVAMDSFISGIQLYSAPKSPILGSSPESISAAFDQCIPGDLRWDGDVTLSLAIDRFGRVVGVRTAIGSGRETVDRAAKCVARKLTYQPGGYAGVAMRVEGVKLTLRIAPRSADRPMSNSQT